MGDVLSQNEIDALLSALNNGDLDVDDMKESNEKQIKDYDFARPSKFSKEHLRTLENIFEHYGRLLSTNLPAYMRKQVQVEVISSEAVTYNEFSNALSNPVLLGIVNFNPLKGNVVLELSSNIGYSIVDRMLGGAGMPLEKMRDFSEIEMSIIERILSIFVNLLREPWKNVVEIEPRLERIETNSQFAQIISPTEMIALITLSIKIGDTEGLMNVCLPYITMDSIMDKLNTKYWFSTMQDKDDNTYQDAIEMMIAKAQIPIRAVLGQSQLSLEDFVNIQCGDIIKLNSKIDDELKIYVGDMFKFKAQAGSSSDSYAVRVTSIVREET